MGWLIFLRRMLAGETISEAELRQVRDGLQAALEAPALPEGLTMDEVTRGAAALQAAATAITADREARQRAREAVLSAAGLGAGSGQRTAVLDDDARNPGGNPEGQQPEGAQPEGAQQRTLTIGEAFMSRAVLEPLHEFRDAGASGRMRVTIPGETRALFATTNNPVRPTRLPGYVQNADQPTTILDLIDRQSISTNSVEWVQETTPPNAAAEVAEGTAKPETTWVLTLKTDTAATIAHYVNITRQTLADDLQLRGYVEGRLSYGLYKRLASQVLNGNGTAPNLRGILNTSGLGSYTAGSAGEKAIVSIRKARTVAELSEYMPDTVVVNPVDLEAIDLTTDTTGAFIIAPQVQTGAAVTGTERVWGLRVISTTAITGTVVGTTGGTFLVGAMREGVTLWERTGVDLFITDSHASNFTSNILTLLAELRAALSVWRPASIVKGTFGASRT